MMLLIREFYPMSKPRGAPVLPCNRWLQAQLEAGHSPRALRREWLQRHYACRGWHAADPLRSYRKAVEGCLRRLGGKGQ